MVKNKLVVDQDKVIVRLPDGMRDRLKSAASEHNSSMNAEIVERLDRSFYEPTELNFLDMLIHAPMPHSLPPGLASRIQSVANQHNRSVKEEVVQTLEAAFPPPQPFSLDDFFDEWATAIINEQNPEQKAKLVEAANAVLRESGDEYEVWLADRGDDGRFKFAFGSKGTREFEAAAKRKRESWGKS